jgi:chromosome segregation ATPase
MVYEAIREYVRREIEARKDLESVAEAIDSAVNAAAEAKAHYARIEQAKVEYAALLSEHADAQRRLENVYNSRVAALEADYGQRHAVQEDRIAAERASADSVLAALDRENARASDAVKDGLAVVSELNVEADTLRTQIDALNRDISRLTQAKALVTPED